MLCCGSSGPMYTIEGLDGLKSLEKMDVCIMYLDLHTSMFMHDIACIYACIVIVFIVMIMTMIFFYLYEWDIVFVTIIIWVIVTIVEVTIVIGYCFIASDHPILLFVVVNLIVIQLLYNLSFTFM